MRVFGSGRERPPFGIDPPAVSFSPELRWLLFACYAEAGLPPATDLDPVLLEETARAFDFVSRLVSRHGPRPLASRLGRESAGRLRAVAISLAADTALRLQGARSLASLAERERFPVVFLKNTALVFGGYTKAGSRNAGDVDVLVREADIPLVTDALAKAGYSKGAFDVSLYQLPGFVHPRFGLLEVHRYLPLVRRSSRGGLATFELLEDAEALSTVEGSGEYARIPSRPALAAHILAHGLGWHLLVPGNYPLMRVVGDLIDLDVRSNELRPDGAVGSWLEGTLDTVELEAAGRLVGRLRAGDAELLAPDEPSPEAVLLRHIVAGTLSEEYRESLRVQAVFKAGRDAPEMSQFVRLWLRKLFPSSAAMDEIAGPARSRPHAVLRRIWRPFDFAVQGFASSVARRRLLREKRRSS